MARTPELLLLLALGLCCPGIRSQRYWMTARFRDSNITHPDITPPEMGQRLELERVTPRDDSGVFWIRQDKGGILHFIVFISFSSETTFEEYQKTSTHFEASKEDKFYQLVVKSFTSQDEGTYFCIMNIYQMLYFSPGQPAFFPDTTEDKVLNFSCDVFIWIRLALVCLLLILTLSLSMILCQQFSKEKELNYFCDIFLWIPVVGACLLIAIALAVTVAQCQ
ncbi:PREDICTED: T-cell surface glycoprotein CD8 alpha chain-like, partial [Mesitornis unicolor]|uniref:T-cell surface glycoprotein CD8 alpha chain-like n=1 Tax=Mesitornis unicolor TaxID=54374 RepID=UPI000528C07D